jgi:uncharacterized membrane protein
VWHGYGDHMGWMWLSWIIGFGILVLLIWAVVRAAGGSTSARRDDSPETILKRRCARGEIDGEAYERLLSDLRK